jgi:hypothetical protein
VTISTFIMTTEDRIALDKAFSECKSAEQVLHEAFLNRRPAEEIDSAIRTFQEKQTAWTSLRDKFYHRWPR